MKKIILFLLSLWLSGAAISQGGGSAPSMPERVTLPNGWSLTPIGRSVPLGDLPLNIVQSTSKKLLAVTCNGQSTQCIELIDSKNEKLLDSVEIPKSWLGLSFSADDKYLYASGGNDNRILIYAIRNNKLYLADSIRMGNPWPVKISPAGLAADDQRHLLYVVTKENDSLYILDLKTKKIAGNYQLGGEGYTCKLSSNKKELYISCWGCDKLLVFDTETRKFKTSIAVGDNPNDICITKNNHFLFVANANDNSVSVIDLQKYKLIETLDAALYPGSPSGSTTNALALSEDERTLYVANADNNCLTVFDVSKPGNSFSRGFIPVGWYPTAVAVNGKKVFVANGKGFSSKANPLGPDPLRPRQHVHYQKGDNRKREEVQYIGGLFKGTMSIFEEPDDKSLGQYSSWVY
ncbi:MAG TPA: YncE family protein, partial [Puia sp.]|nr:YncE family protein [Puia sp.]